jgi:hypothetical protein
VNRFAAAGRAPVDRFQVLQLTFFVSNVQGIFKETFTGGEILKGHAGANLREARKCASRGRGEQRKAKSLVGKRARTRGEFQRAGGEFPSPINMLKMPWQYVYDPSTDISIPNLSLDAKGSYFELGNSSHFPRFDTLYDDKTLS